MKCTHRGITLLYLPGEREKERKQEDLEFFAREKTLAWLNRQDDARLTAENVCVLAVETVLKRKCVKDPYFMTTGAFTALSFLLGDGHEADVIHILKAAGPMFAGDLPAPKTAEKDVPNVPTRAT